MSSRLNIDASARAAARTLRPAFKRGHFSTLDNPLEGGDAVAIVSVYEISRVARGTALVAT